MSPFYAQSIDMKTVMVSIFSKSKLLNCSPSGASVETNIATISRTAHVQHIYNIYCESHLLEIETEKLGGGAWSYLSLGSW